MLQKRSSWNASISSIRPAAAVVLIAGALLLWGAGCDDSSNESEKTKAGHGAAGQRGPSRGAGSAEGGTRGFSVPRTTKVTPSEDDEAFDPRDATHFALLVGTNEYDNWEKLNNPVSDVELLSDTLEDHYHFETRVVKNPTWTKLDEAIHELINDPMWDASNHDQLFVYVAGHGHKPPKEAGGRGNAYLILKDSPAGDDLKALRREGYKHTDLINDLDQIPAEHMLVLLDVCFGGEFFRQNKRGTRGGSVYDELDAISLVEQKWERRPTRKWITSGGDEYVPDGPNGKNSPFTYSVWDALVSNGSSEILTTTDLFAAIENTEPGPHTGAFGKHSTGADFIFLPKGIFEKQKVAKAAVPGGSQPSPPSGGGTPRGARGEDTCGDGLRMTFSGHCCGYGQAWNGKQCVGEVETCRAGYKANVEGKCIRKKCNGQKVRAQDEVHCCWPGQAYHVLRGECVGIPTNCPKDMRASGNECVRIRPEGYVRIESGRYQMGADYDEDDVGYGWDAPQRKVELTRPYWIKTTEVTQREWRELMGNSPSYFDDCGGECPVESVNWYDAVAYVNKLSEKENLETCYELDQCTGDIGTGCSGRRACNAGFECESVEFRGVECEGYRLPTEAEWEYAARAGTETIRYGKLDNIAWVEETAESKTHLVGTLRANRWRVYDMLGNVWEWTTDYWHNKPERSKKDPVDLRPSKWRIGRGGAWDRPGERARAAYRGRIGPIRRHANTGFRPVRTVPDERADDE